MTAHATARTYLDIWQTHFYGLVSILQTEIIACFNDLLIRGSLQLIFLFKYFTISFMQDISQMCLPQQIYHNMTVR